jgi:hypothetical protein
MLTGKVVIVPLGVDGHALARRLAAELEAGGGRPAVFVTAGPDDAGALVEYVEELFRA